jgi:hypothetical protein
MKSHIFTSSLLSVLMTGAVALSHAGSAAAPRIEGSTIRVNASASGISAEAAPDRASSNANASRNRKGAATPDRSTRVEVGTVQVGTGAAIRQSEIDINATAAAVRAKGAVVRIGTVAVRPD